MLELRFAPDANADLRRLHSFIADLNPDAADRLLIAIQDHIDLLCTAPGIGRPYDTERDIRDAVVIFSNTGYIVRYRVFDDYLLVVRIWSGREDRP